MEDGWTISAPINSDCGVINARSVFQLTRTIKNSNIFELAIDNGLLAGELWKADDDTHSLEDTSRRQLNEPTTFLRDSISSIKAVDYTGYSGVTKLSLELFGDYSHSDWDSFDSFTRILFCLTYGLYRIGLGEGNSGFMVGLESPIKLANRYNLTLPGYRPTCSIVGSEFSEYLIFYDRFEREIMRSASWIANALNSGFTVFKGGSTSTTELRLYGHGNGELQEKHWTGHALTVRGNVVLCTEIPCNEFGVNRETGELEFLGDVDGIPFWDAVGFIH